MKRDRWVDDWWICCLTPDLIWHGTTCDQEYAIVMESKSMNGFRDLFLP